VGRLCNWGFEADDDGRVKSTSWMCPGERPGKANSDRDGEGDNAHKPVFRLKKQG
jgi:hypothetical protein